MQFWFCFYHCPLRYGSLHRRRLKQHTLSVGRWGTSGPPCEPSCVCCGVSSSGFSQAGIDVGVAVIISSGASIGGASMPPTLERCKTRYNSSGERRELQHSLWPATARSCVARTEGPVAHNACSTPTAATNWRCFEPDRGDSHGGLFNAKRLDFHRPGDPTELRLPCEGCRSPNAGDVYVRQPHP